MPLAAAPSILTALSGSLYGVPSAREIKAIWLIKLHIGDFGVVNLLSWYSTSIGVLTLFVAGSGLASDTNPCRGNGGDSRH